MIPVFECLQRLEKGIEPQTGVLDSCMCKNNSMNVFNLLAVPKIWIQLMISIKF